MDMVKTFVLLAIFLVLAVGNINNIIRHHKEKKQAIAEGKLEKKERKFPFSKKKNRDGSSSSNANGESTGQKFEVEEEEYDS